MGGLKKIAYKMKRICNTGNVNKIKYRLKKIMFKLLPTKIRKPVLLLFAIMGLWFYLLLMIRISHSDYLVKVKEVISEVIHYASEVTSPTIVVGMVIIAFLVLLHRYLIPDTKDNQKRNQYTKSIYYEVNAIIGFFYVLITVLAILPIVLPVLI
ncbi:hypothetical protein M2475_001608 [Breznakia sp. PF5-3]|uniref:hypothetical protein n=1 Tax=unclassified Breznakia TaxID=2623764 RepID=UPI0024069AB8|nr:MULTISPECIES: hypothetical protein [unclassified Breznakia]MDF9825174.1 hypothetical protein [Breznakia sp. PM6-1]MDF9836032.1 hypothetical protein [Breznakia sp. PF5-3]MDF9838607.1 hypothetical protein [Breznakia sp. PFB2-8]MDF9860624.1 hypothetical protein [Breznakia sp. PH5-24]